MADMWFLGLLIFLACQAMALVDAARNAERRDFLLCFLPPYAAYWALFRLSKRRALAFFLLLCSSGAFYLSWRVAQRDPCQYITQEEVEKVLGRPVQAVTRSGSLTGDVCRYHVQGGKVLAILVNECDAGMLESLNSRGPSTRAFPVSGFDTPARSIGPTLWVQKGERCFILYWGRKLRPGLDAEDWTLDKEFEESYMDTFDARKKLAQLALSRSKQ
jgi:hypothetical protein